MTPATLSRAELIADLLATRPLPEPARAPKCSVSPNGVFCRAMHTEPVAPAASRASQLGFGHQFGHRQVHRPRNTNDGHDSRVLPAALDAAHVGAVDRAAVRQFFLRDIPGQPAPPNGSSKCNKYRVVRVSG